MSNSHPNVSPPFSKALSGRNGDTVPFIYAIAFRRLLRVAQTKQSPATMSALTRLRETALQRREEHADDNDDRTLLGQAVHTALVPLRIATSRPAIKAYLTTLLFFLTSIILIFISTTAYLIFYYNYIPQIGLKQVVYLQYDANIHPHATVSIDTSALITQQPYDIFVTLQMPRTPSNIAAGNFMLDLSLMPETASSSGPLSYLLNNTANLSATPSLTRSRRPAILPYKSHITSLSHKLLNLPIHLLSFKDLDTSELKIPMFEKLSFPRGRSNIPTKAYLEIQSQTAPTGCPTPSQPILGLALFSQPQATTPTLQIYSASLSFHARFEGLRYYVYNYRIVSFLIFSIFFYSAAISSMAIVYAFISAVVSARSPKSSIPVSRRPIKAEDSHSPTIKAEENSDSDLNSPRADLSSTERSFPTLGRSTVPLRYIDPKVTSPSDEAETAWVVHREDAMHDAEDEDEDDEEQEGQVGKGKVLTPLSGLTSDVKDEDEDDEGLRDRDSGIGTSMESEAKGGGSGVARRRSRGTGSRR